MHARFKDIMLQEEKGRTVVDSGCLRDEGKKEKEKGHQLYVLRDQYAKL